MSALSTGGPIRDQLPAGLEAEGFDCLTRHASGRELSGLLGQALNTACSTFLQDPSAENAAEVADLLKASCDHHSVAWAQVEEARQKLKEQEGCYGDLLLEALTRRPA